MNFSGYIIASDADGTLYHRFSEIPERNRDAIRRWTKDKGLFTLATGRSVESARPIADTFEINCPAILLNGSLIYDYSKETVLFSKPLDPSLHEIVYKLFHRFPDIGVEVHTAKEIFMLRYSKELEEHLSSGTVSVTYASYEEIDSLSWNKALFSVAPEQMERVQKYAYSVLTPGGQLISTSATFLELIAQGVSKGSALKTLCDRLHIPREHSAGIGNYDNDWELVTESGIGAMVADSPIDLHKYANYVTIEKSGEGAVGEFIEYLRTQWTQNPSD